MTPLLVALGALAGAPARYLMDRFVQARHGTAFPLGTLAVNVLGSAVLGVLLGSGVSQVIAATVGTGFCGALTTFSTFSYETVRLAETGHVPLAVCNVVGSVAIGLVAVWAGFGIARAW